MPIDKPIFAQRGYPVQVTLPDESEIVIEPVSVEQVRRALRLDPEAQLQKSEREHLERIVAQVEVLAGPENEELIHSLRRALRLDQAEARKETEREYVERIVAQFKILAGAEHAHLVQTLSLQSLQQIVGALYLAGCGLDAAGFAAWKRTEAATLRERSTLEMLRDIDKATVDLAADLRLRPADVAAMPLADCAALRQQIAEAVYEERRFTAAVHGKQLE